MRILRQVNSAESQYSDPPRVSDKFDVSSIFNAEYALRDPSVSLFFFFLSDYPFNRQVDLL